MNLYTFMCLHGDGSVPQIHFNEAPEICYLLNYAMTVRYVEFARHVLLGFRAESAREIDDKAYQQDQANSAATDNGASKVKSTAAEQKKENE
jgi:hypothetical protein